MLGKKGPTNGLVTPLLTDMYQLSMAYAYWKNGKANDLAVFELFFRKNPFGGEYTVFAGLEEVLEFLAEFRFLSDDIAYVKTIMPECELEFFEWLSALDCRNVKLFAMNEGSIVFPREPLIILEGPLAITQLVETTILNLVNYPSLVATNAARMRLAAGEGKKLIEFGLRRAQGPDGGLSASKYAYLGGFDATANVMAGKLFNIEVKGTHAHSFVMSYTKLDELQTRTLPSKDGRQTPGLDFVDLVLKCRNELGYIATNEGELTAFIAYAQSFPNGFLCLVDTYDTLNSGVKNFIAVSWALYQYGYAPIGVRLDSGDLAYLSKSIRELFKSVDTAIFQNTTVFRNCTIVASNDINEDVLIALNREGHEIDVFGVGTHLVTCQKQPALGCVYKLVEINGQPRIKLSQEIEKMVIPGRKRVYRLFGSDGHPLVDLMQGFTEEEPVANQKILVRHPFASNKRAYIAPKKVVELLSLAFDGSRQENRGIVREKKELKFYRDYCLDEVNHIRHDHIRPLNPTPYKISVSQHLHDFLHDLWIKELPISELS